MVVIWDRNGAELECIKSVQKPEVSIALNMKMGKNSEISGENR